MKTLKTKIMKTFPSATIEAQPTEQQKGFILPRYSDEELAFFKDLIMAKLEKARLEMKNQESNLSLPKDDPGDNIDAGKYLEQKEESYILANNQRKFVRSLENALVRIENKTYGICRETGKLIPRERLMLVPHATLCAEAKILRDK